MMPVEFQLNDKARGAIVVHWCDQLPSDDPRVNVASEKMSIPVVLIRKSSGVRLINDLSDNSKTVMVKFVKEASADITLPDYDRELLGGDAVNPTFRHPPKLHFHLRRRLHNLLFNQWEKAYLIHKNIARMCDIFQLFGDFERRVR